VIFVCGAPPGEVIPPGPEPAGDAARPVSGPQA
jgi:hypothetical protein